MILALITVGKYLETRSKGKTSEAITKLLDLAPKTAVVERNGQETEIPVEQVQAGDIVVVRPGASVPVDGFIIEGSTSIEEAAITGESIPVHKQEGDTVIAATMNKTGFIGLRPRESARTRHFPRSSGWWRRQAPARRRSPRSPIRFPESSCR